jgi:hypothetical protein
MSKTDYLTEDNLFPDDQKFVCLSFLTDKENKTTLSGIKVRGAFSSYELACDHAKKIQTVDPSFNVFVGELGKWLPFDPNPDSEAVKNSEYANEQLNGMMKAYLENQEKAKLFHTQRKNEMVRNNVIDNLNTRKENLKELKSKLKGSSNEDKSGLTLSIEEVENQIKKMEEKKDDLEKQITDLSDQIKSMNTGNVAAPKVIDV